MPELPRVRGVSVRHRGRDQEGSRAQESVLRDARQDAVDGDCARGRPCWSSTTSSTFCSSGHPARAARYEFLSFDDPARGRAWLSGMMDKVGSGRGGAGAPLGERPVGHDRVHVERPARARRRRGVARHLSRGVPRRAWRRARRSSGATGANHPDHWIGGLADPSLHALVVLFARDVTERERCSEEHARLRSPRPRRRGPLQPGSRRDRARASRALRLSRSTLGGPHRRDRRRAAARLGSPHQGRRVLPRLRRRERLDAGAAASPSVLSRNGSYLAYLRLEEHVGAFRDFLRRHGGRAEEQELVAAKLMGRWRSGAPLVLAPEKDDPELGADMQRTNDFDYGKMDPYGYGCPIGCAHSAHEPAGHRRQRAAPQDDPARRHLRSAAARGRTRRRRGARDRGLHRVREPGPPVRVRDERLGERSDLQGPRQRARSVHRHAGRHLRHDDPESPDSKEAQGAAGVHHASRRRLLLPARPPRAAVPRGRRAGRARR